MHHHPHHHFRATAGAGVIALIAIGITLAAFISRHDAIAIAAAIVGTIFGIGFWFRWTASVAEIAILDLLRCGGWWTGLELIGRSDGILQRGTIYVHLSRLEDQGLIRSRLPTRSELGDELPTGLPGVQPGARRLYSLVVNRPPLAARNDTA